MSCLAAYLNCILQLPIRLQSALLSKPFPHVLQQHAAMRQFFFGQRIHLNRLFTLEQTVGHSLHNGGLLRLANPATGLRVRQILIVEQIAHRGKVDAAAHGYAFRDTIFQGFPFLNSDQKPSPISLRAVNGPPSPLYPCIVLKFS